MHEARVGGSNEDLKRGIRRRLRVVWSSRSRTENKMESHAAQKYPQLTVTRGGAPRKRRTARVLTARERELDRRLHAVFCAMEGLDGTVPTSRVGAIRKHRQFPWRYLAAGMVELHAVRCRPDDALAVIYELECFVRELWNLPPRPPAAALRKVA